MKALIIFAKNPVPGKVKTRLAATLGNEAALSIYLKLIQHTAKIASRVQYADKFVFYADYIETADVWDDEIFSKALQTGSDLGLRMYNAFEQTLLKKFDEVIIIGSDCIELTNDIIDEAFAALQNTDVVIGPAKDGGYYLLGMKELHQTLFQQIQWSTGNVLQKTIEKCKEAKLSYQLILLLSDIDTEKDWQHWQAKQQKEKSPKHIGASFK